MTRGMTAPALPLRRRSRILRQRTKPRAKSSPSYQKQTANSLRGEPQTSRPRRKPLPIFAANATRCVGNWIVVAPNEGGFMIEIQTQQRGLALAFLGLSLTACAGNVKPEAVEVRVPVYVRLPAELTEPVSEPALRDGPVTNADLADWADALREALRHANGKLRRIEALQPKAEKGAQ